MRRVVLLCAGISALSACSAAPDASSEPASLEPEPAVIGMAPPATRGVPSVVTLTPVLGEPYQPPSETAVMDQFGLRFIPQFLLVHVGQPVVFTNTENVEHNVWVVRTSTDETVLDGASSPGGGLPHVFDQAGRYTILCQIHASMSAAVLVVSAPHAVVADEDGSFSIDEVPPGQYQATVWTGELNPTHHTVEIGTPPTELTLDGTR